ncbi:hypothetical protein D3Z36_16045 [Lachnospiraceae bacterium]|nr:hypothetical protein [Lachnospiraceae bacterium]
MSKNCNFQEHEQIFNFNNLFEMCENMKLCEGFYELTSKDNCYRDIMDKLKSLSSYSGQDILKSYLFSQEQHPILAELVTYVYMSQCSYQNLTSTGGSFLSSLSKTINLNQYGKHALQILQFLQKDDVSNTTADRILAPMYPLQNKIILFDKEFLREFTENFPFGKKGFPYPEKIHSSQTYFKRMLEKFRLADIEDILFPECPAKRKTYRIPLCSIPALTFIFQIYHNPQLPLYMQFSALSDSFINIAVAKGLGIPSILNILYILKKGFEAYKATLPQNQPDKFLEFFQPPGAYPSCDDFPAQDEYYIHELISTKYTEMRNQYPIILEEMKLYRKIEKCILEAFDKWCKKPKNMINLQRAIYLFEKCEHTTEYPQISGRELVKYLNPIFPDNGSEYFNLESAIDWFLSRFPCAAHQYKPIPTKELYHILETPNILNNEMFRTLGRLTYSPNIVYSDDITGQPSFFSPFPLSANRDKRQK